LNDYIQHLLGHNTVVVLGEQFNLEAWLVGLALGLVSILWFGLAARRATPGGPSKGQACVELIVEFFDGKVKAIIHGHPRSVTPLALTIFVWIVFMNTMDLVPLDAVGWGIHTVAGEEAAADTYWRLVPTADLNTTFGISASVFLILIGHAWSAKGGFGFGKELLSSPFHASGFMAIVL